MAGQAHPPRVDESAGHNSLRSIGGKHTVHSWNGGIITGRLHRGCEIIVSPGEITGCVPPTTSRARKNEPPYRTFAIQLCDDWRRLLCSMATIYCLLSAARFSGNGRCGCSQTATTATNTPTAKAVAALCLTRNATDTAAGTKTSAVGKGHARTHSMPARAITPVLSEKALSIALRDCSEDCHPIFQERQEPADTACPVRSVSSLLGPRSAAAKATARDYIPYRSRYWPA